MHVCMCASMHARVHVCIVDLAGGDDASLHALDALARVSVELIRARYACMHACTHLRGLDALPRVLVELVESCSMLME